MRRYCKLTRLVFNMAFFRESKDVVILGPGAVGGFLAAVLYKQGVEVTCVARESEVEGLNEKGITLESSVFGNITARPKVVFQLTKAPDILFVTLKAPALKEAIAMIDPKVLKHTVIIPLMNGFEHIQILRERFGPRVAVGSISIEVARDNKGTVHHLSPHAAIRIASDHDIAQEQLHDIAQLLTRVGIETVILANEANVIWEKLVRLNAITLVIAASGESIGFVRADPEWRKKLEKIVREGTAVAHVQGAFIDPDEVMKQIDLLPKTLRTSLSRDIMAGNKSELDAIAGSIVRAGARYNILCPTIKRFIQDLRDY